LKKDSVLIEPRPLPGDPAIDHPVILALFRPYLDLLQKELRIKKKEVRKIPFPLMQWCTTDVCERPISIFGSPLGSPQAAIMLERLISMGAKKILAFGCCGSLQQDLRIGDWVIPTGALSEEGTSPHYPLPRGTETKPDARFVRVFTQKCRRENHPMCAGKVWTTDALFRETHEKARRYGEMGLLAVDMEMSALFTVAAFRKVRLGGFMVVSDELAARRWKMGFLSPDFWSASKRAARIAVETCLSM
jgi:uridine phosphorylase